MAKTILALLLTQAAAGAALTVFLLVFRRLIKKHVRPGLLYGAWLLVALRLLLPLSLPNPLLPSESDRQSPVMQLPAAHMQTFVPETAPKPPLAVEQEAVVTAPAGPSAPSLSIESLLLILWGVGVVSNAAFMIMANRKLIRRASLRPIDLPESRYPVYLSSLPSPCVLGAFKPVIALTGKSMKPENLRYALMHETCHLRRGDHRWALLRNVLCALYWFSPFTWLAAMASRRDCELGCDDAVNRSLCGEERFEYAKTLLRLAGKPLPFAAAAMSNLKRDMKERLEYIMGGPLRKRSVSVFASILLALTCLSSFATARGTSLFISPEAMPPADLGEDVFTIVSPAEEYARGAWPMDATNYDDLLINMDARVKDRQIYLFTGTVTAIIGSEPQLVTMRTSRDSLYVVLENATGAGWKVGSAYDIFAEAAGKHTDMPRVATSYSRFDYMPRLVARYACENMENYNANMLKNKLIGLERRFGSGLATAAVFKDRLNNFEPNDPYMMDFARALMDVDTAGEYDALMHTHFPGINDALPGNRPLALHRAMIDSMFRIAMGVDVEKYPWRYESCWAPGCFDIRIGEDSQKIRYEVGILHDSISDVAVYPTRDETEGQVLLTAEQIPNDKLQTAMEAARDFSSYLYLGWSESVISPRKAPLLRGQYSGKMPIQFHMLFPDSGMGYLITVDLDTMRVVQAELREMEIGEDGNVVPKEE